MILSQNQKDILRTVITWLVAASCALLLLGLMLFYRAELKESQAALQEVTNTLTQEREQHAAFVHEQELLRSILAAGQVAKDESKVATDDAITKQRTEGTAVHVTGTSLDILLQRSRQVRESALRASGQPDQSGGSTGVYPAK